MIETSCSVSREAKTYDYADVFTASAEYAKRFEGPAGCYMLKVQERAVGETIFSYGASSVLDVGGGHGQLMDLYYRNSLDVTIHGSTKACFERFPAEHRSRVNFLVSSPCELPLSDRSVDLVISMRLLSHMTPWPLFVRELCRVARKAVVIDYPNARSLNYFTPLFFKLKKHIEKDTREYLLFNRRELQFCFIKEGFEVFQERPQFFFPMVLHRIRRCGVFLQKVESVCRVGRLTGSFGSPVIIGAQRKEKIGLQKVD